MPEKIYSLKFTPKASEDLEHIYIYISRNPFAEIAAGNLLERIESSIMRLKNFPYSCSFVIDQPLKNRGYRKLVVDNYYAFYLVNGLEKQVVIMRILYGVQNYQEIL